MCPPRVRSRRRSKTHGHRTLIFIVVVFVLAPALLRAVADASSDVISHMPGSRSCQPGHAAEYGPLLSSAAGEAGGRFIICTPCNGTHQQPCLVHEPTPCVADHTGECYTQ